MNVLIVDDNITFRKNATRFLLKEIPEIRKLDTADNGVSALSFLKDNAVDIVLLDITMPKMGGLEVAKALQEQYPNIKYIFITAYDDVKYLKQAIKLNAFDYLLKPVDHEELLMVMHKMIDKINEDRISSIQYKNEKKLAVDHFLLALIEHGNYIDGESAYLEKVYRPNDNLYLLMIEGINTKAIGGELKSLIAGSAWKLITGTSGYAYIIAYEAANNYSKIIGRCHAIYEALKNECEADVLFYVSNFAIGIKGLYKSKQTIDKLKKARYFIEGKNVISYQDILNKADLNKLNQLFENIMSHLNDKQFGKAIKVFENYGSLVLNTKTFERAIIEKQCLAIAQKLNCPSAVDDINSFKFFTRLYNYIYDSFNKNIKINEQKNNEKPEILMNFIEFVEKNYGSPINSSVLSDSLFISISHLNNIVKKHLNQTAMQYVCSQRLKKACELLGNSSLSVKEIATITGFGDSNYFIKVFKNEFSSTPRLYRLELRK